MSKFVKNKYYFVSDRRWADDHIWLNRVRLWAPLPRNPDFLSLTNSAFTGSRLATWLPPHSETVSCALLIHRSALHNAHSQMTTVPLCFRFVGEFPGSTQAHCTNLKVFSNRWQPHSTEADGGAALGGWGQCEDSCLCGRHRAIQRGCKHDNGAGKRAQPEWCQTPGSGKFPLMSYITITNPEPPSHSYFLLYFSPNSSISLQPPPALTLPRWCVVYCQAQPESMAVAHAHR